MTLSLSRKKVAIIFCFSVLVLLVVFCVNFIKALYKIYPQYKKCENIVFIGSGLGNQMFQYAVGRAMQKETGKKICYDISFYQKKDKKKHEVLNVFNYYNTVDEEHIVYDAGNFFEKTASSFLREKIFKFKKIKDGISHGRDAYEKDFFGRIKRNKRNYLKNFAPNFSLFNKYRQDLLNEFKIKTELDYENKNMLKEIKKHKNSVSIHVRRGDFLLAGGGVAKFTTIENYYKKAFKIFKNMEDVHYFVFSDDIEWVKNNLNTGKPTTFVNINSSIDRNYLDIELMKNCKHNIIPNSTFSWWAGWLNENKNKIVTAPRKYWTCAIFMQIPDDWIIIDNTYDIIDE